MLPLAMLCSEDLPYTHGHGKDALEHFQQMCVEGVEPDRGTLLALLAACSNAGQLDEGLCYIESMGPVYHIPATIQLYACMVDLLGHPGQQHKAKDLVICSFQTFVPLLPSGISR
jgi:hypothetical protein